VKLSFHGADRDVTGSCHLVECAGKHILIDCGLFQGSRALAQENAEPFGFDAASIDLVLLTHAHLDHCGRLPLLCKRGFRGEIIATAATRELARLVMLDAAHLQEEDARSAAVKAARRDAGAEGTTTQLYSLVDAMATLDHFHRCADYGVPIELAPGVTTTFYDAGHILGSASILLDVRESGRAQRVLFSGDLGNAGRPLLLPPAVPPRADVVVIETTYGDRLHKPIGPSIEELYAAVSDTFGRGGNVIIPTFGLERAQELLYVLSRGVESGRLMRATQVFLDSPMAISATEIFERYPENLQPQVAELFRQGRDPFHLPGLHFTRERSESMALNNISGGAIIMAGSGMATGGRVRHHLRHNLWRQECGVIFVGFAAQGTLARQIIDGANQVQLFGEEIPVRASVHTINGFSAHADQAELLAWHRQTGAARTFLTHGEESIMQQFAAKLAATQVEMPAPHQTYAL
jgi:metallo-beta-lactamase family protein